MRKQIAVFAAVLLFAPCVTRATMFTFDNASQYTPLPIDLTVDGITAHLSGTGQSYSIQQVGTLGIAPVGFSGNCIFPSSVYASDLLVGFSRPITDFSIMYAPQELACDSSAQMKVTAYSSGTLVGSSTATASPPGTWPTGTLAFSSLQGFDSVVVHYNSPPPTGGDYGVIFLADNMSVTPAGPVFFPGDANLDGKVDFNDLSRVLTNYDKTGMTWAEGDFNSDGKVDLNDLSKVLTNYDKTAAANLAPVPEPSSVALFGLGIIGFLALGWWRCERQTQ